MKTKYYIGIISALLLTGYTTKAQIADMGIYQNDDAKIVINNYYDDYDYYYSSVSTDSTGHMQHSTIMLLYLQIPTGTITSLFRGV